MTKTQNIKAKGTIKKVLPSEQFRVNIDETDKTALCHLGGNMRQHNIRLVQGDRVKVELSPYDLSRGYITYRIDDE